MPQEPLQRSRQHGDPDDSRLALGCYMPCYFWNSCIVTLASWLLTRWGWFHGSSGFGKFRCFGWCLTDFVIENLSLLSQAVRKWRNQVTFLKSPCFLKSPWEDSFEMDNLILKLQSILYPTLSTFSIFTWRRGWDERNRRHIILHLMHSQFCNGPCKQNFQTSWSFVSIYLLGLICLTGLPVIPLLSDEEPPSNPGTPHYSPKVPCQKQTAVYSLVCFAVVQLHVNSTEVSGKEFLQESVTWFWGIPRMGCVNAVLLCYCMICSSGSSCPKGCEGFASRVKPCRASCQKTPWQTSCQERFS